MSRQFPMAAGWYPPDSYAPTGPYIAYQPYTNRFIELGKLGAVVGLCGAGAANLRRLQNDEVTRGQALAGTLKTGVASGIATGAAALVGSQFRSPLVSFVATLATGTVVMYALTSEKQENPDER